jgi:hypothetical protein
MLAFGQGQRWRRRRNLFQRRPDQLAVLAAMSMRDVSKLWMNE